MQPFTKLLGAAFLIGLFSSTTFGTVLLSDDFSYSNGELRTVGSAKWVRSSGTSNDLNVTGGRVFIGDTLADDATAAFTGVSSGKIFASFTLTGDGNDISTSPTGSDWFAAFLISTSQRSRVFSGIPTGTASGKYRLGLTNALDSGATFLATDLTPDTAYTVVVRFDFSSAATTLWVNPTSESDPGVTVSDTFTAGTYAKFGLRQPAQSSTGAMGDFFFDNLNVATTFAEVVPEPATMTMLMVAVLPFFSRRRQSK